MNLVVTATGVLGGMVTRQLLAEGKPVRALVRPNSSYQQLEEAGAEIAIGDLRDPESLRAACAGVDHVIVSATAPLMERHIPEVVDAIDWHGVESLIDIAKEAGVKQLVYVSFLGASADAPLPLAHAKGANELYLQQSGLPYTILQPVFFMEVWVGIILGLQLQQGPSVTIVGDGQNKLGFVSDQNVADLVVAVLGDNQALNTSIPLNGPGSYTYREIIGLIETATGQSIEVKTVAPGEAVPGMPPLVSDLWAGLGSAGDMIIDTSAVAERYGIKLVRLEDYVQQTFKVIA
jgi:uncharacterized protein YbjT (DUF2867 family)